MRLIGLSGKAGSGKDFVAQILRGGAFVENYLQLAFAWPLKLAGMDLMGFTYDEVFVTKPPHVRKWLQEYGLERRGVDENYWVGKLDNMRVVHERAGGIEAFVISDVRFPNEAEYVKSQGGILLRMEHSDRPYPLAGTEAALHPSETALDDYDGFDAVIENHLGMDRHDLIVALYDVGA